MKALSKQSTNVLFGEKSAISVIIKDEFSQKNENYLSRRQTLPVFQHGFLSTEESVDLHNLRISVSENVNLHKFQHYGVRC